MATTNRELVQAAINNKSAKCVPVDSLKSSFAIVATVEGMGESWVSTGHIEPHATVYFNDNTFIRTKAKLVIATIAVLADDPVYIDGGFAVVINKNVKFARVPMPYVPGKTYDTLTMTVGED